MNTAIQQFTTRGFNVMITACIHGYLGTGKVFVSSTSEDMSLDLRCWTENWLSSDNNSVNNVEEITLIGYLPDSDILISILHNVTSLNLVGCDSESVAKCLSAIRSCGCVSLLYCDLSEASKISNQLSLVALEGCVNTDTRTRMNINTINIRWPVFTVIDDSYVDECVAMFVDGSKSSDTICNIEDVSHLITQGHKLRYLTLNYLVLDRRWWQEIMTSNIEILKTHQCCWIDDIYIGDCYNNNTITNVELDIVGLDSDSVSNILNNLPRIELLSLHGFDISDSTLKVISSLQYCNYLELDDCSLPEEVKSISHQIQTVIITNHRSALLTNENRRFPNATIDIL